MKFPRRTNKKETEEEKPEEKKIVRKERKNADHIEKPRDPTRWLSLFILLIFLFISYLSWVAFQS